MRILHTADWHMNATLGRQSLSNDVVHSLEQIAHYLEEYRVDVMIVAGDLFCDRSRREQLQKAIADIRRLFRPFLIRGGTIIAITGNHDSEIHFRMLRDALDLVAPIQQGAGESDQVGRLYMLPRPRLLKLADSGGQIVQFVAMPYPTASCYLSGEMTRYHTIEEKHRAIHGRFMAVLDQLKTELATHLPSVLISHIHVRGADPKVLYRVSEREDVVFEPSDIPTYWSYVAYGHIHCPQTIFPKASHIRYAGSIARMDQGEGEDDKSVVLFEIVDNQLLGEPRLLPLNCPPLYHLEITAPEVQQSHLIEKHPDAARALVSYTLHWDSTLHSRDELCHILENFFPRWYKRVCIEVGNSKSQRAAFDVPQMQDVAGTVRSYLEKSLTSHPDKQDLLQLAEELMANINTGEGDLE